MLPLYSMIRLLRFFLVDDFENRRFCKVLGGFDRILAVGFGRIVRTRCKQGVSVVEQTENPVARFRLRYGEISVLHRVLVRFDTAFRARQRRVFFSAENHHFAVGRKQLEGVSSRFRLGNDPFPVAEACGLFLFDFLLCRGLRRFCYGFYGGLRRRLCRRFRSGLCGRFCRGFRGCGFGGRFFFNRRRLCSRLLSGVPG